MLLEGKEVIYSECFLWASSESQVSTWQIVSALKRIIPISQSEISTYYL